MRTRPLLLATLGLLALSGCKFGSSSGSDSSPRRHYTGAWKINLPVCSRATA